MSGPPCRRICNYSWRATLIEKTPHMLTDFFYTLRAAKVPVSVREYLTLLEALQADVVMLQEVRLFHHRDARRFASAPRAWPQEGQAEFLAPQGYHCIYRTNAVTRHGEHGNALLSRWPVGPVAHRDVSDHRFEQRGVREHAVRVPRHVDEQVELLRRQPNLAPARVHAPRLQVNAEVAGVEMVTDRFAEKPLGSIEHDHGTAGVDTPGSTIDLHMVSSNDRTTADHHQIVNSWRLRSCPVGGMHLLQQLTITAVIRAQKPVEIQTRHSRMFPEPTTAGY